MKNLVIALGLTLAASTAAYADSSALDVVGAPSAYGFSQGGSIDYTATASIGVGNEFEQRGRLGDGSPTYTANAGGSVDYTATASTSSSNEFEYRARFGDGSPVYVR
jgi:hypothetical protein